MTFNERIRKVLNRVGGIELSSDPTMALADSGVDSLIIVMALTEFEKEFSIKISAGQFKEEFFENLKTLEVFLKSVGAK